MDVRTQIAGEVNEAMERAIALEQGGVMSRAEADSHADTIIAIIRDALTSPEAHLAVRRDTASYGMNTDKQDQDVGAYHRGIRAALAAAGLGGQGDE